MSFGIVFLVIALITGFAALFVAVELSLYVYPAPRGMRRWCAGLFLAFLFSSALSAGFFSYHPCNSYTASEYKYGSVPVSCVEDKENKQ